MGILTLFFVAPSENVSSRDAGNTVELGNNMPYFENEAFTFPIGMLLFPTLRPYSQKNAFQPFIANAGLTYFPGATILDLRRADQASTLTSGLLNFVNSTAASVSTRRSSREEGKQKNRIYWLKIRSGSGSV